MWMVTDVDELGLVWIFSASRRIPKVILNHTVGIFPKAAPKGRPVSISSIFYNSNLTPSPMDMGAIPSRRHCGSYSSGGQPSGAPRGTSSP